MALYRRTEEGREQLTTVEWRGRRREEEGEGGVLVTHTREGSGKGDGARVLV